VGKDSPDELMSTWQLAFDEISEEEKTILVAQFKAIHWFVTRRGLFICGKCKAVFKMHSRKI
jgi:hypothetical protein